MPDITQLDGRSYLLTVMFNSASSYLNVILSITLVLVVFWGIIYFLRKGKDYFTSMTLFGGSKTDTSIHKQNQQEIPQTHGQQQIIKTLYVKK